MADKIFCERCGKQLVGPAVWLELDQRINGFHDFGGVPEVESQGWFEFGADCAKVERKRARTKLAERGIEVMGASLGQKNLQNIFAKPIDK